MKKFSYLDMVKTLLPENEYIAFTQHYQKPLQKSIKILTSKTDIFAFKQRVSKDGRTFKPPNFSRKGKPYDDVLFVEKPHTYSLGSHPLHQAGYFYVQEMAAGLPAQILNIQPNTIVLDLCAAPGGKSIQLADKLLSFSQKNPPEPKRNCIKTTGAGLLISNEPSPSRRKALQSNLERCGIRNSIITGYDARVIGTLLEEQCDSVLLDAPCSGEGMQYKSDFKCYHRNEKSVKKLSHLQGELLISGLRALKVGGELVYSTCTTNNIENEGVIASVLEVLKDSVQLINVDIKEKSLGITTTNLSTDTKKTTLSPKNIPSLHHLTQKVARFRPHIHHTGGFFIAKFKKINSLPHDILPPSPHYMNIPSQKNRDYSKSLQERVQTFLQKTSTEKETPIIHMLQQQSVLFIQTKHTIRAVAKKAINFLDTLYIEQMGNPIIKILNDGKRKLLPHLPPH